MKQEEKIKVKIKSTRHTAKSSLGFNSSMLEMVGKIYTATIFERPPIHVHVSGWTFVPEDVHIISDRNVKLEFPKPETFNTNLLDT